MNEQVEEIVSVYNKLEDYDKGRTYYVPRHKEKLTNGGTRQPKRKTGVTPGVDSVKRLVCRISFKS